MKTNPLKLLLLSLTLSTGQAFAFNRFDCLRDLMPITERAMFQKQRKSVEEPFLRDKHMVFPEVQDGQVVGFFVYDHDGAWHYDRVEIAGKTQAVRDLKFDGGTGILEMVAQPKGLETFSLIYLPGFDPKETDKEGPVMLGSSVLPVVGAMISRPARHKNVYNNPDTAFASDLRRWVANHSSGRFPATDKSEIKRTLVRLVASTRKDIWGPIDNELRIRRAWIQSHNLDQEAFRDFSRVVDTSCKE